MGIASLVLGIISILANLFGQGQFGMIFAIIGIVLGALGRKNPSQSGIATAGLVCSIVGLIMGLLVFIACMACVGILGSALNS
ncbi:MAG: hypothetical protein ACTTK0_04215 [Stomatobaculum sp.]